MSSTVFPTRTREQALQSLAYANRIRLARAALKLAVRDGDIDVWHVIEEPHPDYHGMKVYALLLAQPKWGPTKTSRFLRHLYVSEAKTLAGLSPRQRAALVEALRERPDHARKGSG